MTSIAYAVAKRSENCRFDFNIRDFEIKKKKMITIL